MGHPNPQNLKPFKKGQCGNPNGRPKTKHIEERFQAFLSDLAESKDGHSAERLEVIMKRLFVDAAKGDTKSAALLK